MCVGRWAGVTFLPYTVLTSPNKGETAINCCDPVLSVLVMLVSRNVFHVVSLQSIVFKQFSNVFKQSLTDPTLAALNDGMRSLVVCVNSFSHALTPE